MKKTTLLYIYCSLVFLLFFDLWVENSEQATNFFGKWIEPFIDEPKFSLVWTVLIVVGLMTLFKYLLDEKEEGKNQLEKTLESEMAILVAANRELNEYRLQDNLVTVLNRFVAQNSYVSAVQWYQYSENNIQGKTIFKFSYQYGSVAEAVNVNAVQQIYYECDTEVLKLFRIARKRYRVQDNPDLLVDFIVSIHTSIFRKDSLTAEDAVQYAMMTLAKEIIEKDYGLIFEQDLGTSDNRIQQFVDQHRTGILRAALMEDEYYSFTHTRINEKFNRQYIARLGIVREESFVFTLVLDASILEEEEYDCRMLNIAKEFENLLIGLEKGYNKSIEKEGDGYAG
ncbi:hypothetical protein JOC78_002787 [Bacillus ectoiniformans]|uniref:hypothetical protein n=1 Tax=Bacillus ectoiniformans TaxID=1494429 RepID=UPI00195BC870|nr:hypothetical protein [Bacillus ectoiniformans]MBM7649803.1 hypothetical protein [Bacillus ectoiniformans]